MLMSDIQVIFGRLDNVDVRHSSHFRYTQQGFKGFNIRYVLNTMYLNTRRENPYLQAAMYYFIYCTKILITTFLTIYRRFPKILQMLSEGNSNVFEYFL